MKMRKMAIFLIAVMFCCSMFVSTPEIKAASTGWLRADIESVTIMYNNTKYKDSYMESQVNLDCFQAIFSYDNSTGKLTSACPKQVRLLYGSYSVYSYSLGNNGHSATVTYGYKMNSYDAKAKVRCTYYF